MKKYIPRIVDKEIDDLLKIMGGVLIEGCKWCGKSTTGMQHAKSIIELQNPNYKEEYDRINKTKPSLFLNGDKPRMFDEWQMYPVIWDAIRNDVDHTGLKGQYILTGSARPIEGSTMHTGTGRISRVLMRPMSLYESNESTGEVSLMDLFNGKDIKGESKLSLEDIANITVRGGWPAALEINGDIKYRISKEYVKSLIHEEVKNIDGVERNPEKMQSVLRSIARNICNPVSNATIVNDVKNNFNNDISRPTLNDYINTLERLYIIEEIKSTNLKLRSKYTVRTTTKKIFVDPSIATATLEITPTDLVNDLNTFGFMFESLCLRDLEIYSQSYGGNLTYYRDENDFEIDAILKLSNGKWGAIEIKLGSGYIDEAAKNLLKLKEKISKNSIQPSFLMVLTGANYSYRREDGVYVVSIGTLKD